jgi:hypothetical protein
MSEDENGRATIREVYALVSDLRSDIAAVDAKVDRLQAQETRLAVIERLCAERPRLCALQAAEANRTAAETRTDRGWTRLQRYGWVVATIVAVVSAVIGWTH